MTIKQARENIGLLSVKELEQFIHRCNQPISKEIKNKFMRTKLNKMINEDKLFFEQELIRRKNKTL
jgi:hypothetical protein